MSASDADSRPTRRDKIIGALMDIRASAGKGWRHDGRWAEGIVIASVNAQASAHPQRLGELARAIEVLLNLGSDEELTPEEMADRLLFGRSTSDAATWAEPAVVVIEMPPAAPKTKTSVERAVGYLLSSDKSYQTFAHADVVVGRWGVERGDADGGDLYETALIVSKDRLDRSEGVTFDGTSIDPGLFKAGGAE